MWVLHIKKKKQKKTGPMDTQEIISLIMAVRALCGLKLMDIS